MINKAVYIILVFMLAVCAGGSLFSQGITDSIFIINEVEVSAPVAGEDRGLLKTDIVLTSLPQAVTPGLTDLISANSPIFVKSSGPGSVASVSFRGTASSHTRIEWNGIELNNPMLGQADLSLVPVFAADEISIFPGGSSLAGGSGALGGSIRIRTKPSWDKKLYGSVRINAGSYRTFAGSGEIGGGSEHLQTRLRLYRLSSENNFRYYNSYTGEDGWYRQKNAGFVMKGVIYELNYRNKKENVFSVKSWYQDTDRNFPALMTYSGDSYREGQKGKEARLVMGWTRYFEKGRMKTDISIDNSEMSYSAYDNTALGSVVHFNSENSYNKMKLESAAMLSLSRKVLIRASGGISMQKAGNRDMKTGSGYDADRYEAFAGTGLNTTHGKAFSSVVLVRAQLTDNELLPLMPFLGLEFHPQKAEGLKLKTSIVRNYKLPGLNDMYWIPGGNPDLSPEQGFSGDFTAEFVKSPGRLSISIILNTFYSRIHDWILWQPGDYVFWKPVNIDLVLARGGDINIETKYEGTGFKTGAKLNYSFTRTSNMSGEADRDELKSLQLIYIPLHKANGSFSFEYKGIRFLYQASLTGRRYTTSSNEDSRHSLPAFDLHHFSADRKFKVPGGEAGISFGIRNLFNKQYQAVLYRAMPGRSFNIGLYYGF